MQARLVRPLIGDVIFHRDFVLIEADGFDLRQSFPRFHLKDRRNVRFGIDRLDPALGIGEDDAVW